MPSWLKNIRIKPRSSAVPLAPDVALQPEGEELPATGKTKRKAKNQSGPAWLQTLRSQMATLQPREKMLLNIAIPLLLGAALWWLGLAPALSTLRQTSKDQTDLDNKIAQMQLWAAQAKSLQSSGTGAGAGATGPVGDPATLRTLCAGTTDPAAAAPAAPNSIAVRDLDARTLAQCLGQLPVVAAKLDKSAGLWSGSLQLSATQP